MTDSQQLRAVEEIAERVTEKARARQAELIKAALKNAQQDIVASVEWLTEREREGLQDEWEFGVGELRWTIEELTGAVRQGFERVERGVDRVYEELTRIRRLLERPRATAGDESRRDAEFAKRQGWLIEALEGFLDATEKNYQDYRSHLNAGILYRRLDEGARALECFEKAAKYARPHSQRDVAAALFNAARVREELGDLAGAYEDASEAFRLDSSEVEIGYLRVRLAARTEHVREALETLREVLRRWPKKALEVRGEQAFASIQPQITELLQELLTDAEARAQALLESVAAAKAALGRLHGQAETEIAEGIDTARERIREELKRRKYIDTCQARDAAQKLSRDAWTEVIGACERLLESLGAEGRATAGRAADLQTLAATAMRRHAGRGWLVFLCTWFGLAIPALVAVGLLIVWQVVASSQFVVLWGVANSAAFVAGMVAGVLTTRGARLRERAQRLREVERWEEERRKLLEQIARVRSEQEAAIERLKESGTLSRVA